MDRAAIFSNESVKNIQPYTHGESGKPNRRCEQLPKPDALGCSSKSSSVKGGSKRLLPAAEAVIQVNQFVSARLASVPQDPD